MTCNWCGTVILDVEEWKEVDHLYLHSSNNNTIRVNSCEAAYREYCRFILAGGNVQPLPNQVSPS